MTAGRAFRIRPQNQEGERLSIPQTNACHGCYRPLPDTKDAYCSGRCLEAHHRLKGAA